MFSAKILHFVRALLLLTTLAQHIVDVHVASKRLKSFWSHLAHGVALISDSMAPSQTKLQDYGTSV